MPTTIEPLTASRAESTDSLPPCPECATGLRAVGAGRHRYWSCRYCGTTMPRR